MRFQTGQLGNAIKLRIIPYWVGNKNTLPTYIKFLTQMALGQLGQLTKLIKKKSELFPHDKRLITKCLVSLKDNNEFSLTVNST